MITQSDRLNPSHSETVRIIRLKIWFANFELSVSFAEIVTFLIITNINVQLTLLRSLIKE